MFDSTHPYLLSHLASPNVGLFVFKLLKIKNGEAGVMAQRLRAVAVLPEVKSTDSSSRGPEFNSQQPHGAHNHL